MRLDFLNDIEFKGNKTSIIIKWIIGIAIFAVVGAFVIGQLKMRHLNKIDHLQKETVSLREEMKTGFIDVNNKLEDIYNTGIESFEEYRIFNNKQLELIIEFGQSNEKVNQELLKRMLKLNSEEKALDIKNQIEQTKRGNPPVNSKMKNLPSVATIQNIETGETKYFVSGAPENYLDTLDVSKFKIIEKEKSKLYNGLFDFVYITIMDEK